MFKENNSNKFDLVSIKSIYFVYFDTFEIWLGNQKITEKYKKSLRGVYRNLFNKEFRTINELRDIVNRPPNVKYKQLAVRTWIKFLKDNEVLPFETILEWKDKIKVNAKSNIDSYVPTKGEITGFLSKLKGKALFEYICARIFLESGCRGSEFTEFLNNFNERNVEIKDNVVIYSMFRNTGNKNSFYMFMTKDTYDLFISNFELMQRHTIEKTKVYIKRNNLIPLKYMRKYNFTLMIQSGVNFEIANFIQGRASANIGFNHYLAKKEIAIKEYEKISF